MLWGFMSLLRIMNPGVCTMSLSADYVMFVCVEVLRPSQPLGVMSSTVGLPNHTFTGQDYSSKRLTSILHILLPETDNCPSWISGRERMTVENISWSVSTKGCCRPSGVEPATSWSSVGHTPKWATEATVVTLKISSRSPKSNQFFVMSQLYIHRCSS